MNTFTAKVEFERQIIRLVNKRFGWPELCGLSHASIETWACDNRRAEPDVIAQIRLIASLLRSANERSGERVLEEVANKTEEVGPKITILKEMLGQ
jgi:hypothetical protein